MTDLQFESYDAIMLPLVRIQAQVILDYVELTIFQLFCHLSLHNLIKFSLQKL